MVSLQGQLPLLVLDDFAVVGWEGAVLVKELLAVLEMVGVGE